MDHAKAITLIDYPGVSDKPSVWADLGSGEGTFTYALAAVLATESVIYAVDQKLGLSKNSPNPKGIRIIQQVNDFEKDELDLPQLDGILMANSIHYISDKTTLIRKLEKLTSPDASFLIVEYDTMKSNQWVPFPLEFRSLTKLFHNLGFSSVTKLGEVASVYQSGTIYSALVQR